MLKAIIPSRCRRKLLSLFFLNSDKEFYLRQIAKLTDQPVRSVQLEIQNLCDARIVNERRKSNRRLFKLNKSFYYYDELMQLIQKTMGLQAELEKHLRSYKDTVQYAVVEKGCSKMPVEGEQVCITLLGKFSSMNEEEKEKLIQMTTHLPFSVTFQLKDLGAGFEGGEDHLHSELEDKVLLYSSNGNGNGKS